MTLRKRLMKQRNIFAHWIIVRCNKAPNHLLLLDYVKLIETNVVMSELRHRKTGTPFTAKFGTYGAEDVYAYTEADLKRIIQDFDQLQNLLNRFWQLVHTHFSFPPKEEIFQRLCSEPPIDTILARLRGRQKRTANET